MAETERYVDLPLQADLAWAMLRNAGADIPCYRELSADEVMRRIRWKHGSVSVVATVAPNGDAARILLVASRRAAADLLGLLDVAVVLLLTVAALLGS